MKSLDYVYMWGVFFYKYTITKFEVLSAAAKFCKKIICTLLVQVRKQNLVLMVHDILKTVDTNVA